MTAKTLLTLAGVTALIYNAAYYVFPGTCTTVCCLHMHDRSKFIGVSTWPDDGSFNPEQGRTIAYDDAAGKVLARENAGTVDTGPGFFSGLIQTMEDKVHSVFSHTPEIDIALPLAEPAPVAEAAPAAPGAEPAPVAEVAPVTSIAAELAAIPEHVIGIAEIAETVLLGNPSTLI